MLPGDIPDRKNQLWENWGKTARCRPELAFFPRNLADLSQIINFARENHKKIRVAASGHSWSALVPTDEILVVVQALNRVTLDLSDPALPRAVIESGTTVCEVNNVLEQHGYCLPFNVVLESVRFGGLIATGSHGSGWQNCTLSDLVHSIEIVTADGQLRKFECGVASEDVMNAARLNLGMFGIIYRMTLNIQKSWNVRARDQRLPITTVLGNLQELVLAHDNLDLFWWPFSDRFWVKSWQRTDAPFTAKPRRSPVDRSYAAITAQLHRGSFEVIRALPRITPAMSRLIFAITPSIRDQVLEVTEAIHYRRSIEVTTMGCVEVAFKLDADFSNAKEAIDVVFQRVKHYAQRGKYPMNVTMNVRFLHNSNCWLSPAYGEGHTCYIEILSRTRQADWEQFSGEIGCQWLKLPQAMPHWAKEHRHIPGVVEHIKHNFAPNIARFNQIKAQLQVDPEQMFVNQTLGEIFL